ncbi:MAG: 3-oxoacyl-ACP reductase FabG [Anaerolineae bacterium]|nr:3-oxoacyl-ACP reductase FabG [Anaerolineae bacterium]
MDNLTGKVALVTGASRGIGRAIAVALAQVGVDVAVNYQTQAAQAEDACAQIRQCGRRTVAVQADVSQADAVNRMVETVERELGPIEILVNNAGVARRIPIDQITEADWDLMIDTNLKSVFLVTQKVLPGMRARHWGRIINLGSIAAQSGGVIGPAYAASKAGIHGLTHSYAALLAKEGITVNAIAPALVVTDMITSNSGVRPDLIPVGRLGEVAEVADVAVMLAGNGYITGQTVNVNGGWYMV